MLAAVAALRLVTSPGLPVTVSPKRDRRYRERDGAGPPAGRGPNLTEFKFRRRARPGPGQSSYGPRLSAADSVTRSASAALRLPVAVHLPGQRLRVGVALPMALCRMAPRLANRSLPVAVSLSRILPKVTPPVLRLAAWQPHQYSAESAL